MNWIKWVRKLLDKSISREEFYFRRILLAGIVILAAVLGAGLYRGQSLVLLLPVILFLALLLVTLWASVKWGRYRACAGGLALAMNLVVFPLMYFLRGGVEGSAPVCFVLGIGVLFLLFEGKTLAAALGVTLAVVAASYGLGYVFPGWVTPVGDRLYMQADSLLGVLFASILVGTFIKRQEKIYRQQTALAEQDKEHLEELNRRQNAFFASMSHEIRTPINTIIGLNEMTLREDISDEVAENAINIQNASKMLLSLINDVLDLSRIEAGRMQILPTQYETGAMFSDLVNIVWIKAHQKDLEFKIDISQDIPSMLYGDEMRIKQVLANILTNAVKYTSEGSVTLTAKAERSGPNSVRLKVTVADTGMGIKKDDLDHLFESFRRMDEEKNRNVEGTGLGLAIAKQLVDMMGGTITVDSIYTKGSTFTVTVEQKIMDETPIGALDVVVKKKAANRERYRQSFEAPEARILIVDDNEMNLTVAAKLLKKTKVQIDTAKSGAECLEKTRSRYYNVIFMDHMMPQMSGVETLKRLRRQQDGLCQNVPVIALTANAMSDADELYQNNGFQSYLAKPINGALLEATLLKFLPDDVIEYVGEQADQSEEVKQVAGIRKRPIAIISDCVCDLPSEWMERYEIGTMHYYVYTASGRFKDGVELTCDNLVPYLQRGGRDVTAGPASVEEYETLFADALQKAEQVIHITMGRYASGAYDTALEAAKGFDNVYVVDSGHLSSSMGLMVLDAAMMAQSGSKVPDILDQMERMKALASTSFLVASPESLYRDGKISRVAMALCSALSLHPILYMSQSRFKVLGLVGGDMEQAGRKYIRKMLRPKNHVDDKICFVTHAGCTVKQQNQILEEIKNDQYFEKICVQKASATVISNCGLGTFGVLYLKKW